jgi:hypothetical protein
MHKQRTILGFFRWWWQTAHLPLCISEFGTPETYNPSTRVDEFNKFVTAGVDANRIGIARQLADALRQAKEEGIPIPYGGWYPGTGNIGWGYSLTRDRKKADCDRAGLVDLARQPDGSLKRVLCRDLVEEILALRQVHTPAPQPHQQPGFIPPHEFPLAAGAAAGD